MTPTLDFDFRLDKVLNHRATLSEQQQKRVVHLQERAAAAHQRLDEARKAIQAIESEFLQKEDGARRLDPREELLLAAWKAKATETVKARANDVAVAEAQLAEARKKLDHCLKDQLVIEHLKEREFHRHTQELRRREANALDEASVLRFSRVDHAMPRAANRLVSRVEIPAPSVV